MTLTLHSGDLTSLKVDLLALLCFQDQAGAGAGFADIDKALDGLLGRLATEEQFKGKPGQTLLVHTHGRIGPQRVLLVGGGARGDFQPPDLRGFAARAVKAGGAAGGKSVAVALLAADGPANERAAQFVAEGALGGRYRFDKYLTGDRKAKDGVEQVILALTDGADPQTADAIRRGLARGEVVAAAVARTRDLINEPAGFMTPTRMAEVAQQVAKEHGLEVKVLGRKECQQLGMGMFLAVAQGSDQEPRFIHLTWRPKGGKAPRKRVALVGKGVTFDSGGLSLKPTDGMLHMKADMSGAAAVISAIAALADLGVPVEVHAIAACTENMPSGKAYKLGDVLTSMGGKTVEITNTDAEGRLTLGDALTYAVRETKPDELIDFATLTGACVVALGPTTAGVMSNHRALAERWLTAAREAGEDMWPLPLTERLKDQLKSEVADMRNTGERWGGALTAGLFLKEFVGDTPWVHVDIAGPANADKEWGHLPKGGTGFAVATILEYLARG